MKDDMSGGAAVAGGDARTRAARARRCRVIGIIPTTENMPGGTRDASRRRADRGASGKTVEVINTDAEGRLILGDALWYAQQARRHASRGRRDAHRRVHGRARPHGVRAVRAAATSGSSTVERAARSARAIACGRCRSTRKRREQLRSEIADMVNSAGRPGGAVTAAAFLREFAGDVPWAHLDIAGTAWAETKEPYQPKGADRRGRARAH